MAGIALQMLVCYMKAETILKDEHLPPTLYSPTPFFSEYALQIFCTQRFLSIVTKYLGALSE